MIAALYALFSIWAFVLVSAGAFAALHWREIAFANDNRRAS